jgi:prepilin-type N-terminal cleavage/methylation domain-containing protein
MKTNVKKYGLTLLEMLIVIALIAILASMILMATMSSWADANTRQTKSTMVLIEAAMDEYRNFNNGDFPDPNKLLSVGFPPGQKGEYCHSASLYFLLNSVPDSKKILERIPDSQREPIPESQNYPVFLDAWKKVINYEYYTKANLLTLPPPIPKFPNYPLLTSAGPDKDFLKTDDNITNKK